MPDNNATNRRNFDRYAVDLEVEANGLDQAGEAFCDKARLDNLSGSGIGLLTRCPSRYWQSQVLSLKIKLPDTERMEAHMICKATVQWIHSPETTSSEDEPALIGLLISEQRMFEGHRKDVSAPDPKPDHP